MEKTIQAIIEKIRLVAKYNPDIKEIVTQNAEITLEEIQCENTIKLKTIEFSYYDKLIATSTELTLYPDGTNQPKKILEYKSWNELISL